MSSKVNLDKYLEVSSIIKMILFIVLSIAAIIILNISQETNVIWMSVFILLIFFVIIFYSNTIYTILSNINAGQTMVGKILFSLLCIGVLFLSAYFYHNIISFSMHNIGIIFIVITAIVILFPTIKRLLLLQEKKGAIMSLFKKILGIGLIICVGYILREFMNSDAISALYTFLAGLGLVGVVVFISNKLNLMEQLGNFAFGVYTIFASYWASYFIPDLTTFLFSPVLSNNLIKFMNNIISVVLINVCIIANFLYYVQDPFTILKVLIIIASIGIFTVGMAVYWAPVLCDDLSFIEEETGWGYSKIIGVILTVLSLFLVRNIYKTVQFAHIDNKGNPSYIYSSPLAFSDIFYAIVIYGALFVTTELTWEKINLKKNLAESVWLRFGYSFLVLFVGSMLDYKIANTNQSGSKLKKTIERGLVWLIVITFFLYSVFKMGYLESVDETEKDILSTLQAPK